MGLFGEYANDIADAPDDPFSLADGHYRGAIIKVRNESGEKKADGSPWSATIVTLSAEGESATYDHFLSHPMPEDKSSTVEIKKSNIKKFLMGCEVPRSRMDTVTPEDLEGLEVIYELTTSKNGFRNLKIRLAKGSGVSVSEKDMDIFKEQKGNPAVAAVSDDDFGL